MTRNRAVRWIVSSVCVLATTTSIAAPPQISGSAPFGVKRGETVEVNFNGGNLGGNPRLVAPFSFKAEAVEKGVEPSSWKFKLTADPSTAIGVYPIRILTDEGLSNPFLFSVGQLVQVSEVEDNSSFEQAQAIFAPCVVEGQAAGNDVDYFKFSGKKGQKIVVDALCARIGSGVDPSIRLTTSGRKYVASADDSPGLLTDARMIVVLPADSDYVIELSDSRYQGTGRTVYRLVVGEVPLAEEIYPMGGREGETLGFELRGGTLEGLNVTAARLTPASSLTLFQARVRGAALDLKGSASGLDIESLPPLVVSDMPELREATTPNASPVRAAAPVVFNGRIDPAGDEDRFVLEVTPGGKIKIEVDAAESGSALDGILQVLGPKGAVLATADDTTVAVNDKKGNAKPPGIVSPDPKLESFTVPAGVTEITLALRDLESRGGTGFPYRIIVKPVTSDFEVVLNDAQIDLPGGGTTSVGVTVIRKGYNGPITVKVADPPAGLIVRPGTIAEGQLIGAFTVATIADAKIDPVALKVIGEGQGPEGAILAVASKTIVFASQATLPTNAQRFLGLTAATTATLPLTLEAPIGPIEVTHGYGIPVHVKAIRQKDATGALAITTLPLPPGLTAAPGNIGEKADETSVTLTTAIEHPLGLVTVGLIAKGKISGADRVFGVPAVTLNILKPVAIELSTGSVELKAGTSLDIKGKVVRKSAFKEPVTVKLSGLPAGTKADPVTVPPDQNEFTLKLSAEEKAASATTTANASLAFQVNKKDYPAPLLPSVPLSLKVLPAK